MVFIKLRATNTPTRDFLMGLKKATGLAHHKIRRAFVGTKISRNPELALSKQEVSKALARFQKKSDRFVTKEEQKDLEDFLNKRYKVEKKEQMKKNIERAHEAEKEARGKNFKKTIEEEKNSSSSAQSNNSSPSRLDISDTPYTSTVHQKQKISLTPRPFISSPSPRPSSLSSSVPKPTEEPDDLPID